MNKNKIIITDNDRLASKQILGRDANDSEVRLILERYWRRGRMSKKIKMVKKVLMENHISYEEEYHIDSPTGLYFIDFYLPRKEIVILICPTLKWEKLDTAIKEFKRYRYHPLILNKSDFTDNCYIEKICNALGV